MRVWLVLLLLAVAVVGGCSYFRPAYECSLTAAECRVAASVATRFVAEGGATEREGAMRIVAIDGNLRICLMIPGECPPTGDAVVTVRFESGTKARLVVCTDADICSDPPRVADFTRPDAR